MPRKSLRVVTEDEQAPKRPPMTVSEAAESGTRLDELIAIRTVLARAVDSENTSPRDLAALTRRQIEVSREIDALRIQEAAEAVEAGKSSAITDKRWKPEAI